MKYRPTSRTLMDAMSKIATLARCGCLTRVAYPGSTTRRLPRSGSARRRRRACGAVGAGSSLVSPHQEDQWEQEKPQQVDHVPKASTAFEEGPLVLGHLGLASQNPQRGEHRQPNHEMKQ